MLLSPLHMYIVPSLSPCLWTLFTDYNLENMMNISKEGSPNYTIIKTSDCKSERKQKIGIIDHSTR